MTLGITLKTLSLSHNKMTRPYPSHQRYTFEPKAVAVTEADKVLAPMTQDKAGDIESLHIGKTSCQYLTKTSFQEMIGQLLLKDAFHHIVTLNPEMVMEAEVNPFFEKAVAAAFIRIPDGAGLVWSRWYIRSEFWSLWPSLLAFPFVMVERIPGVEAIHIIAEKCAKNGQSVYLLGGTEQQVVKTVDHLRQNFPKLVIHASRSHLYDVTGPASLLQDINDKKPAAIFVAYGAPRQSIWIENHKAKLPTVKIAMGVGGAFAMLADERPRAPKLFRQLNAEWLWRLILEPKRLPRIWRATIQFPLLVHRQKQKSHL